MYSINHPFQSFISANKVHGRPNKKIKNKEKKQTNTKTNY